MIQLSRMTDYALLVLTHFAKGSEGAMRSARDLAQETELPAPTVSKVLKTLTRAELLNSQRGAQGGYSLARNPSQISVAEIIQVFEGPVALTVCSEGPGKCDLESQCLIRSPLQVVNDAIRGTLENLDLASIAQSRSGVAVTFAEAAAEVASHHAGGIGTPLSAEAKPTRTTQDHADQPVRTGSR